MRVMTPSGTVVEVKRAITICEQRGEFNGRVERRCECAQDIIYANGIVFVPVAEVPDICDMTAGGSVLFGNLTNSFVREVLSSLVRQGYADLSDLRLQKMQSMAMPSDYKFDNGASGAYLLKGYEANASIARVPGYPFTGGAFPAMSEAEDSEEEDCADEQFEGR